MNYRFRSWHGIAALMVAIAVLITSVWGSPALGTAKSVTGGENYSGKTPKYVFMFIGDGMSYAQVSSAEMFLGQQPNPNQGIYPKPKQFNFTQFPTHGSLMTQDSTSFLPDSASTATSLASGHKTLSGVINMDETKTKEYHPITEALKAKGYKIGIVTSVPITHATPAAFYSKVASRSDGYAIGQQLAASGFDYFGGGGFEKPTGANKDQRDIHEVVQEAGYQIADTKEEIEALNQESGKVVAINPVLDADLAFNYEIDRANGELSLADFVKKGIEVLDNPKGFFMMVEGGKIDWANHANDAAASIHDTMAFADAVQQALEFYQKHPNETLILVTADHETGGMSLGWSNTGYSTYFGKLKPVSMSYLKFDKIVNEYIKTAGSTAKLEDLLGEIQTGFGIADLTEYEKGLLRNALKWQMIPKDERNYNEQEKILYGTYEPFSVTLSHIVNNRAGLSFASYSHTGVPVPVYATGLGSEMFNGFYDNTGIYYKMAAITKIK